jgi:hypothetical protein
VLWDPSRRLKARGYLITKQKGLRAPHSGRRRDQVE